MASQYDAATSAPQWGAPPPYGTMPQRATPRSSDPEAAALSSRSEQYSHVEDPDLHEYEDCEETAYSGAMATIIKDFQRMSAGSQYNTSRVLRISFAIFICVGLSLTQVYVLITIKTFVTSPAVRGIRNAYGSYEEIMYHGHVENSGYGFSLGIGGRDGPNFDPSQFSKVPDDLKGSVCLIPFSQPAYLSMILFIWSLSVIGELKMCFVLLQWLKKLDELPLKDAVVKTQGMQVIVGLPKVMKATVFFLFLLPRLVTSLLLFWLGCRWLAATLDFTEVLINAIALEFVIHLNSILYEQLITDRNKRELKNLKLHVKHSIGKPPNAPQFVGACIWVLISVSVIYLYIAHFQMVLPGYQWDVRGPCGPWVSERFNFWRV